MIHKPALSQLWVSDAVFCILYGLAMSIWELCTAALLVENKNEASQPGHLNLSQKWGKHHRKFNSRKWLETRELLNLNQAIMMVMI